MARTKPRTAAPDIDDDQGQLDPDGQQPNQDLAADLSGGPLPADPETEEDSRDEDEIRRIFSSNTLDGGYIRIMRRPPGEINYSYCDKVLVSAFDLDHLKKLYGGGMYRLTAYNARGKYVTRKEVAIDERIKGELDQKPSPGSPIGQGATVKETIDLAKQLQFPAPAPAPAAPPRDDSMMMTLLMKSMESQTAIMVAALSANRQAPAQPHGLDIKDLLPLLIAMVQKPDGAKPASIGELMAAVKQLKELTDGDDEPKGIMDSVTEMLPGLIGAYSMAKQAQAAPAPAPAPVRAQVVPSRPQAAIAPAGPEPEEEEPEEEEDSPVARPQGMADIVIDAARRGAKPELYASMVVDMTPPAQAPIVKSVLTGEAWFAQLFGGYPDAAALRPWLEKLRTLVLDAFNRASTDPKPPLAGAGDPARVPGAGDPEKAGAG